MAENVGVMPPDYTTLAGKVRVLVGDTDPTPIEPIPPATEPTFGEYSWYSDAELEALGGLMDNNPKRVAVWVLSQVAISEALLLKHWKTDDLAVNGPAITNAIERTIARLSKEIEAEEEWFDVVGGTPAPGWRRGEGATWPCPCGSLGGACGCVTWRF